MALKIRLSRQGAKKQPQYLIVATDSNSKRDGEYLEKLGYYYPKAKEAKDKVKINLELYNHWKSNGAAVTQTVNQLVKSISNLKA